MSADQTHDAFLGGRVHVWQPARGYRAGVDAVLLAAAVPARAGDTVLELGCGAGTAALCLAARVPGLAITGVEVQPAYAALATRNAGEAGAALTVHQADLRQLPDAVRLHQYGHVMMNPPYFDRAQGTPARDTGRDTALAGDTALADWLEIGTRRLAPNGTFTLIQHITRLPEVLTGLAGRVGSVVVCPIAPRPQADPNLFILQAKHSGRAPFRLSAPLVMHRGEHHDGDGESYTPQVTAVLRDGAALLIGG